MKKIISKLILIVTTLWSIFCSVVGYVYSSSIYAIPTSNEENDKILLRLMLLLFVTATLVYIVMWLIIFIVR